MLIGAKSLLTQLRQQIEPMLSSHYSERELNTMLQWLLEHIAQIKQVDLLLNRDVNLSDQQYKHLTQAIERINQEEPIQYILEEAEFYGRKFQVSPAVLIPRQETEELVHLIVEEHKEMSGLRVLDIGTGSGCIAVTLAKELGQAQVWGIDHSVKALAVAKHNAKLLDAPVHYVQQNILTEVPDNYPFDVVVSNPPYVLKSEFSVMRRNVVDYEPPEALFVEDANPLLFYERISELCDEILTPGGQLYFEIHEHYASEVSSLVGKRDFARVFIRKDTQHKDRFVIGYK